MNYEPTLSEDNGAVASQIMKTLSELDFWEETYPHQHTEGWVFIGKTKGPRKAYVEAHIKCKGTQGFSIQVVLHYPGDFFAPKQPFNKVFFLVNFLNSKFSN